MSDATFWSEIELTLLPDEEILLQTEPDRAGMVRANLYAFLFLAVISFGTLLLLAPALIFNRMQADRHRAFVTNQRVVVTDGLFGYETRSVPLERISDVQVGCTWLERLAGIRKVTVRDMTGETMGGAVLKGLHDPKKVQQLILTSVRRVNERIQEASPEPAPTTTGDQAVVSLLTEIRDLLQMRS